MKLGNFITGGTKGVPKGGGGGTRPPGRGGGGGTVPPDRPGNGGGGGMIRDDSMVEPMSFEIFKNIQTSHVTLEY